MGGEGGISPETGIFYPWVTDVLARHYKALVRLDSTRFHLVSGPRRARSPRVCPVFKAFWLEDPAGAPVLRRVVALRQPVLRLGAPDGGDEQPGGAGGRRGAHRSGAAAAELWWPRRRGLLPGTVA